MSNKFTTHLIKARQVVKLINILGMEGINKIVNVPLLLCLLLLVLQQLSQVSTEVSLVCSCCYRCWQTRPQKKNNQPLQQGVSKHVVRVASKKSILQVLNLKLKEVEGSAEKGAEVGDGGHLRPGLDLRQSRRHSVYGKLNSANTGGCGGVVEERLQSFRQNFLFFGQRQYRQARGRGTKGPISATEARHKDDRQMPESNYQQYSSLNSPNLQGTYSCLNKIV